MNVFRLVLGIVTLWVLPALVVALAVRGMRRRGRSWRQIAGWMFGPVQIPPDGAADAAEAGWGHGGVWVFDPLSPARDREHDHLEHLDGVPWDKVAKPSEHHHWAQTRGMIAGQRIGRCPCGAVCHDEHVSVRHRKRVWVSYNRRVWVRPPEGSKGGAHGNDGA